MTPFSNDFKYALRMLAKHPGFTVIALVTLAIGIGVNTTAFSLLNILFLRPVQVERIDELAVCDAENVEFFFNYAPYQALRENNPVFTDLAAVDTMTVEVTFTRTDRAGLAHKTPAYCVSSNYFSVLGCVPAQGRWFLLDEERYAAEPVVILSYQAWKKYFEKSDVVRSQILLNDVAFRVVGVAPKGFTGLTMFGTDFWLPLGKYALFMPPRWRANRGPEPYPNVIPFGRIKPQLDRAAAQARLQAVAPGLKERFPGWWGGGRLTLLRPGRMSPMDYFEQKHRFQFSRLMLCLMFVSVVVLVMGAALGIYAIKGYMVTSRTLEIGIRMALGSGQGRMFQLVLKQGLKPVALGIGAGWLLALSLHRVLSGLLFGISPTHPGTFLLVGVILMSTAALACTCPARRAMTLDPMEVLRYE